MSEQEDKHEEKARAEWESRRAWLLSLGMKDKTIRTYRLDRYRYMTEDAWLTQVQEALRSYTTLSKEQMNRKIAEWQKEREQCNRTSKE